ncbi:MAG: ArsR/SmtB family transcription factor [Phototrophicaceae bacterium]
MKGDIFDALADPTRRQILMILATERLPVHQLAQRFDMARPSVSQHIKVLYEAGLLIEDKVGRERFYRTNPAPFNVIRAWFTSVEQLIGSPDEQSTNHNT